MSPNLLSTPAVPAVQPLSLDAALAALPYRLRPSAPPSSTGHLDQTRAPLVEAIHAYREDDILPFTVPGHKQGRGVATDGEASLDRQAFRDDIPLAGGADDLQMTRDILARAERLAADAFGAHHSFFGVGGSSLSNQIALLSVAGPGDEIVVTRNAHKSTHAAVILSGARPIYVHPRYDAALEVAHGVTAADLAATLDAHPHARAAVVVSPTYYGVAADLPALAAVCHARGIPLIVDEAWGAHCPFHPALPPAAMAAGADIGVTSIHKVLTGFSQSSILNLRCDRVPYARVAQWAGLLRTTSPSALILASIDSCRRDMALHGRARLARVMALSAGARATIATLPGLRVLGPEVVGRPGADAFDVTKLVIDVEETGLSGYAVDAWLRDRWRIAVELSDHRRILALLTIADDANSVGRLLLALSHLSSVAVAPCARGACVARPVDPSTLASETVMTPQAAVNAPSRHRLLADAVGSISAEMLTPYPPGIPIIAPGERITRPVLDYLRAGLAAGMYVTGAADPSLATIRAVAE